jgi:hypothetical protein
MSPQKIQDYIDDHSFDTPPLRAPNDPTGVPNFPPEEGRGDDFQPFNLPHQLMKFGSACGSKLLHGPAVSNCMWLPPICEPNLHCPSPPSDFLGNSPISQLPTVAMTSNLGNAFIDIVCMCVRKNGDF